MVPAESLRRVADRAPWARALLGPGSSEREDGSRVGSCSSEAKRALSRCSGVRGTPRKKEELRFNGKDWCDAPAATVGVATAVEGALCLTGSAADGTDGAACR